MFTCSLAVIKASSTALGIVGIVDNGLKNAFFPYRKKMTEIFKQKRLF